MRGGGGGMALVFFFGLTISFRRHGSPLDYTTACIGVQNWSRTGLVKVSRPFLFPTLDIAVKLTPINQVNVWFGNTFHTSTMISETGTGGFEVLY